MNYDRFEQFNAYTDNALPDAQRRALEQQLADDNDLRAELDEYRRFRFSLESITLNRQLDNLYERLDRQGKLNNPNRPAAPVRLRQWRLIGAGIAGLLLVGLSWFWLTLPTPAEQAFAGVYRPEAKERGTGCGPELTPGLELYRARDYAPALTIFRKLPANQPCVRYYRGLTELALGQALAAVDELKQALAQQTDSADFATQKNEWYLALAYLKASQPDQALPQLRALAQQPNHRFRRDARKAIDLYDHAR